ncbi:hypothetical protein GNY06_11785 [Elizabethkingia argentiflava]|uniref:PBCV-specific basic adaptor domain-containing protein n=1 Tax=Elizabethkingia argenteiflava TaxID=2681556 RepID=A0A845PUX0_9FLAO|nr:hypothetical protein [Elizabethkingia argenteiflava]NAW52019.1 hypothetical protein [Elizabethkingia argenteiflava]
MKNLLSALAFIVGLGLSTAQTTTPRSIHQTAPLKKEVQNVVKETRKETKKALKKAKATTAATKVHLKKDGSPDRRYKSSRHLKKDGAPDRRYKENRKK